MTDPQDLWVGPGSQAAQEKAAYEVRRQGCKASQLPATLCCRFCGHGRKLTLGHAPVNPNLQAAFGPFYRITQLILTTTPAANSSMTTPSGLPAIVTGKQSCWQHSTLQGPQRLQHRCNMPHHPSI